MVWSGFTWLRIGIVGGCCERGDEHSGSGATDLVKKFEVLTAMVVSVLVFWAVTPLHFKADTNNSDTVCFSQEKPTSTYNECQLSRK
jgi:hypothetical protein